MSNRREATPGLASEGRERPEGFTHISVDVGEAAVKGVER